jgi:hypothetical protein
MSLDSEQQRFLQTVELPQISKFSDPAEKAILLNEEFNFSKRILCRGNLKLVSYQSFRRAQNSKIFGF